MMDTELLNGYLDHLKARGLKTLGFYRYHLHLFRKWLSSKKLSLAQLSPALMNEYLSSRRSAGYHLSTLKVAMVVLRGFFRYAWERGVMTGDPMDGVICRWLDVPGGYPAYQGPLRKIFRHPWEMLKYRLPIFAPHWENYLQNLLEQGYHNACIRKPLIHNLHFHRYLACKGIKRFRDIEPSHVKLFLRLKKMRFKKAHRDALTPKTIQGTRRCIVAFLRYAFDQRGQRFSETASLPETSALSSRLLNRYLDFCRVHKGLKAASLKTHAYRLRKFGEFLEHRGLCKIRDVALTHLDDFLMHCAKSMKPPALEGPLGVLRSFFRYLHLHGTIRADLARDLLTPCRFSADLRPKYLSWSKVQELLGGIDRSNLVGKRDYAILTLLAYHGLRAREAAKLKLSDIDWENNSFLLRERKNGDTVRLPLSEQAKAGLQEYLTVRPPAHDQEIFLTVLAPIKPVGSNLCFVAKRHLDKRFPLESHRGSYVLRHSFAKVLLDRGARLPEIGTLLGHRNLRSTLVYTRIATEDMREVADNYANLL